MSRIRPLREGIMLATTLTPKYLEKMPGMVFIQPKLRGVRARIEWFHNEAVFISSYNNIIFFMEHLQDAFTNLITKYNIPKLGYDGELYIHGATQEEINATTSGIVNRPKNAHKVTYQIFDIYDSVLAQEGRFLLLDQILLSHLLNNSYPNNMLNMVETNLVNKNTWQDYLVKYVNSGYEGIIIRNPNNLYQPKRIQEMLKFKPSEEDDYEIVEIIEGKGRCLGKCGSVTVKDAEGVIFNVGSGFKDEERSNIWDRRNELPGKFLRVKHEPIKTIRGIPICTRAMKIIE
jgi:ATP-dependent DNA ligase